MTLDTCLTITQTFTRLFTFRDNKEQPLSSGFIAGRGTADAILRYLACSFFCYLFHFLLTVMKISKRIWNISSCLVAIVLGTPALASNNYMVT
jgi:hypothetical protein